MPPIITPSPFSILVASALTLLLSLPPPPSDETVARTVADMISNFEMKMSCVKTEIGEAQENTPHLHLKI